MTTEDVDGFVNMFASGFGEQAQDTSTRQKRERRAGLTKSQRKRGGAGRVRDKQVNFRTSAETKALVETLVKKTDLTLAEVIEAAIDMLAKSQGLGN